MHVDDDDVDDDDDDDDDNDDNDDKTPPVLQVSSCPSSLLLGSRRTWIFLMDLEMVSDGREHPSSKSPPGF